jgi:purine nucleoside permease
VDGVDGAAAVDATTHATHYGHAFALATLYNVGATVLAFVLFWRAWRRHA